MSYDIYFVKISFHTNYNCNKISPPRAMMQREKIYYLKSTLLFRQWF